MPAFSLTLLQVHVADSTTARVLAAIAEGVRAASERLPSVTSSDDNWNDLVTASECDVIEDLLGAAYVVCQSRITAITSAALAVRKDWIAQGHAFNVFGADKSSVRALGSPLPGYAPLSAVEVIWALANYFKHHDEWPTPVWVELRGNPKSTADVVGRVGLTPWTTGNMRAGAKALGNVEFDDMAKFSGIVDAWASNVYESCNAVLVR